MRDSPKHPTPAGSVGVPTPTAALIANLQGIDVAAVEHVLVGVREALQTGNTQALAERLTEQALLLEALGVKLLYIAGKETRAQTIQIYTGLALRALDQARKAIAALSALRGEPRTQTNVQVNVARDANELLDNEHDKRLVG